MLTPPPSHRDLDAPSDLLWIPPFKEPSRSLLPPSASEPRECICGGIALSELEPIQMLDHLLESSQFTQRLNTNYAPSGDEILQIMSIIDDQNTEIGRTTQRIADLQQEIVRLCRENAPRTLFVRQHKALLAPIRRLPVDLLREIFGHCVASGTMGSMHKDDAPMVLSHVCSAWREIALSTPQLWSSIHISIPPSRDEAPDPLEPRIAALSEWLTRSVSTPLRLSIYQQDTVRQPDDRRGWSQIELDNLENARRVMEVLLPAIHRWKVLRLVCPFGSARFFFQIPGSEWASIQEIWVVNIDGDDLLLSGNPAPGQMSQPGLGPFYSPHLSMVTLCHVPYAHDALLYSIPWNRITHLCIPVLPRSPEALYSTLLNGILETIVSLELVVSITSVPFPGTPPSVDERGSGTSELATLPRLKRFALKELCGRSPILKLIQCPMLEELEYDEARALPDPWPAPDWQISHQGPLAEAVPEVRSLLPFLSHSGALVKSLAFNHCLYNNQQLRDIFASIPLVESISHVNAASKWGGPAQQSSLVQDVFKAFVTPDGPCPGASPYCPGLRVLRWGTTMESGDTFLEFLELKQSGALPGVRKLDEVVVRFISLAEEQCEKIVALFPDPRKVHITGKADPRPRTPPGIKDGLYITNSAPWDIVGSQCTFL